MHPSKLSRILDFIANEGCTPTELLLATLRSTDSRHHPGKLNLITQVWHIFDAFSIVPDALVTVKAWIHQSAKTLYMQQVRNLTDPAMGFHFNVQNASVEQIEAFSMGDLLAKMRAQAPQLCDLVTSLLTSDPALEARRVVSLVGAEDVDETPERVRVYK